MNNNCCGSQLYHTGLCCNDQGVNVELINEALKTPEEKPLKDCACKGLGPCQCPPEEKKKDVSFEQFKSLSYVGNKCGSGEDCRCN